MVFALVFGVLLVSCPAFAVQGGFSRPYTHYADDEDLTVILTNFARSQGLGASFSPGVVGKVSGRFDAVPPETFLKGMQAAFGVTWYRLGSTLYFYSESELSRAFITPRAMTAERLYQMLRQSAVFAPQLPATLAPGGAMIVVSGPPTYLAQISAAVTAFEEAQITNFVMKVFPLKYAWAEDMSVNSMDKTVTIPGVASILRAMVTGSPNSATRVTQDTATVDKLSGTGLIAQGRMTPVAPDAPAPAAQQGGQAAPQNATQVNIMADPRVNAVLVNDAEYRMPYYAKVIADLDRPVELVEIHAAIVDIDSDFKRDLGVTYQGANSRDKGWSTGGEFSGTGDKFSPLPTMGTPSGTGMNLSTIYTHGADFFLARIQALEAEGEARMLGRPSVLTVDNVQATLENTSTYYIQVEGYQAVDLFKVEAGTVLRVTPHIIRNERGQTSIKLAVSVQDDQNDSKDAPVSDNSVPPIKQTKINTQAIVGAGQSLLIGGYYYEQKSTDASGIPILMHIPVLGNLFKTTSKGTKRMERLILITPKVIHLDEIPTTPPRVDEPTFHRSPTQADYEERVPAAPQSGCSRKRPELETVTPATATPLSPPAARQPPGVQTQRERYECLRLDCLSSFFRPPHGGGTCLARGESACRVRRLLRHHSSRQFSRFPAREHRHRLFRGRRPVRAGDAARRRDTAQWRSLAVRRCGHPRAYAVFSGLDLHGMVGARRAGGRMASGRVRLAGAAFGAGTPGTCGAAARRAGHGSR